ncbi:YdcF family protein [Streptomyces sp. NRRL S-1022]|uniref:YdcF family protein n=1 Tax=Streptomyces sp. NRRL S-1022 TaxID=1463880 RepID=UPI00068AAB5F|nr:YdcF family protein [Streptomyces sp. NRRL S-1022]
MRFVPEYPEYVAAAVFAVGGIISALPAPHRFSTAVLFCLAVTSTGLGVAARGTEGHGILDVVLAVAALLVALVLGLLLVADGVLLVRRYGPQPVPLASGTAGCAVLAVLGLDAVFHAVGGEVLRALVVAVNATAGYLTLLFLVFTGYVIVRGRRAPLPGTTHVVVLGAGLDRDRPGPLLARRLESALTVDAPGAPGTQGVVFVVSGGQGEDEVRSEADAMADYLRARGVAADRIVRENRSVNTGQNLRFSVALMDHSDPGHRATVVTSNFHVYRTTLLASRLGVPVRVVGAPTSPAYWLAATLREFAAVLWLDRLPLIGLSLLLAVPVATAIFWR